MMDEIKLKERNPMNELMKALTDFLKEATLYLARQNHPPAAAAVALTPAAEPQTDKPARKPRVPKTEPIVPAAPVDLMLDAGAAPAAKADMTEIESSAAAQDAAKAIVQRFPKSGADNRPEGFHLAKKLLNEDFRVARITDLVHAQRLQFITKVKALIAGADKQPVGIA